MTGFYEVKYSVCDGSRCARPYCECLRPMQDVAECSEDFSDDFSDDDPPPKRAESPLLPFMRPHPPWKRIGQVAYGSTPPWAFPSASRKKATHEKEAAAVCAACCGAHSAHTCSKAKRPASQIACGESQNHKKQRTFTK